MVELAGVPGVGKTTLAKQVKTVVDEGGLQKALHRLTQGEQWEEVRPYLDSLPLDILYLVLVADFETIKWRRENDKTRQRPMGEGRIRRQIENMEAIFEHMLDRGANIVRVSEVTPELVDWLKRRK